MIMTALELQSFVWHDSKIVQAKMSQVSLRLFLSFYNFAGTLSITNSGENFEISKLRAIFNLVKMLLIGVFCIFFMWSKPLRLLVFRQDVIYANVWSQFTKTLILVTVFLMQGILIYISFTNFIRKKLILNLVKKMSEFSIGNQYSKELDFRWKKNFSCMRSYAIITITYFAMNMNFTITSFVCMFTLSHVYWDMACFVSFVKSFEIFLVILLEDFAQEISNASQHKGYKKLLKKIKKIHNLNMDFHKIFGDGFTLMTCYIIVTMTTRVNIIAKS